MFICVMVLLCAGTLKLVWTSYSRSDNHFGTISCNCW